MLFAIAFRNLTRNRRRTMLTLAALVVGLTVLVTIKGYVNAIKLAQIESTVYGFTGMMSIHKTGYMKNILNSPLDISFPHTEQLAQSVLSVPGVVALTPRISLSALYSSPPKAGVKDSEKNAFFSAMAVEPKSLREVSPKVFEWLSQGRMLASDDAKEMVINADVAKSLLIDVEANLNSRPPEEHWPVVLASDKNNSLNGDVLLPIGTLNSAIPGDKRFTLLPLKTAQALLRMDNLVTEYVLKIDKLENVPQVQTLLVQKLGPDFEVLRWDEVVPFMKDLERNIDFVFGIISFVFMLVVLLGVVNAMLMNVLERTREIGTLMALGIRAKDIRSLFVLEGMAMGFVGGLVGIFLGVICVTLLSVVGIRLSAPGSHLAILLKPSVTIVFLIKCFSGALLGSGMVSFWPAYKASRLKPVEALQSI